jgi:hypothetical protein
MKTGFVERTIENWLANTDERGFQYPFCQILLSQGFKIIHNSPHNAFEQGKDIIAQDSDGKYCAYQLKKGKLSLNLWRTQVKSEVEELIDLPIKHPSVPQNSDHRSFLVVSGEIDDTVRVQIEDLNAKKWKDNPLITITFGELLQDFLKLNNELIPPNLPNYKLFLDLYFDDAKGFLNTEKFTQFQEELLFTNITTKIKPLKLSRLFSVSTLYTAFIISKYRNNDNNISVLKGLILQYICILMVAEKENLHLKYYSELLNLIESQIKDVAEVFMAEIEADELNKMYKPLWDGELGKYRANIAYTYYIALALSNKLGGIKFKMNVDLETLFKKSPEVLFLWSESSYLSYIFTYMYECSNKSLSQSKPLIEKGAIFLCKTNNKSTLSGLASPYYEVEKIIKHNFNLNDEFLDETFGGRSYMLRPLIDCAVHASMKNCLKKLWHIIPDISQEHFEPKELWEFYKWRCTDGHISSNIFKESEQWGKLKTSLKSIDTSKIPQMLLTKPYLLPLFLACYPHRISPNIIKHLLKFIDA